MEIKDIKEAENLLIKLTLNDEINEIIEEKIASWNFGISNNCLNLTEVKKLVTELEKDIFEDRNDLKTEALLWVVFDKTHDICMEIIRKQFLHQDSAFFEKCKILSEINISATQFGVNENYDIPLLAAIVELSVLDKFKTPIEKMNCLCTTFDLVFAEIKTAMVSVISEYSEKEQEIPIIDNTDVIPLLMMVIIKSKLLHMFSNLSYIRTFYENIVEKRTIFEIFTIFEKTTNNLMELDLANLTPIQSKIVKNIDIEKFIKITSNENEFTSRTLVDEANQRVLKLIVTATSELP